MHTLYHAVTLKFDPLNLNFCSTSNITFTNSVRNLNEIEQSADDLANFQGQLPNSTPQRWMDQAAPNVERTELHHRCIKCNTLVPIMLLRFEMKVVKDELCQKLRPNFALLTALKNYGRGGENVKWEDQVTLRPNL